MSSSTPSSEVSHVARCHAGLDDPLDSALLPDIFKWNEMKHFPGQPSYTTPHRPPLVRQPSCSALLHVTLTHPHAHEPYSNTASHAPCTPSKPPPGSHKHLPSTPLLRSFVAGTAGAPLSQLCADGCNLPPPSPFLLLSFS